MGQFFNFESRVVEDWWSCRSFVRGWWRKNERDRRWVPPFYNVFVGDVVRRSHPHLRRLSPVLIELDAVERSYRSAGFGAEAFPLSAGGVRVGQVLLLADRGSGIAHVALLEVANDEECVERLLDAALARAVELGCGRLLVTLGMAPAFPRGVLVNCFDQDPPLHTAYNPPFLADVLAAYCTPVHSWRLWHVEVSGVLAEEEQHGRSGEVVEVSLVPDATLSGEWQSVVRDVWRGSHDVAFGKRPPDGAELDFVLERWGLTPMTLLLARVSGVPAGFVLLQADVGPALRRARGGYPLWGRFWLWWNPPVSALQGRWLAGAVAAGFAGVDVWRALWVAALAHACACGWRSLAIGPVEEGTAVEGFLVAMGAQPRQRYVIFAYEG